MLVTTPSAAGASWCAGPPSALRRLARAIHVRDPDLDAPDLVGGGAVCLTPERRSCPAATSLGVKPDQSRAISGQALVDPGGSPVSSGCMVCATGRIRAVLASGTGSALRGSLVACRPALSLAACGVGGVAVLD